MNNHTADLKSDAGTSHTRLAAVIPAFNEGATIGRVVTQVKQRALPIVIDDGSTDDTAEQARNAGAYLVIHPSNRGYDAALETGIRTAIDLGCVMVVTIDADGQHDPSLLDFFALELAAGADLVIGIRDRTQRWSEFVFGMVSKFAWGVEDLLCGIKGYQLSEINKLAKFNNYESVGTELALKLISINARAVKIKISVRPRCGDSRFGSGVLPNLKVMRSLFFGLVFFGFRWGKTPPQPRA